MIRGVVGRKWNYTSSPFVNLRASSNYSTRFWSFGSRKMTTVPFVTRAEKKLLTSETRAERLLPGVFDEVVMDQIVPKLSWRDLFSLASVSRGWRHAFLSRQVYNARVRSISTETRAFLCYSILSKHCVFIHLYSMKESSNCTLRIPHLDGGIPARSECLILDAKMYVLGGWVPAEHAQSVYSDRKEGDAEGRSGSAAVHVLDIAGGGHWKKCAKMQNGRARFGCGVLNGKIYVFGGIDGGKHLFESEVYDPISDTWSPIMPMKYKRLDHRVSTVGEELVLHGGSVLLGGERNYMKANFAEFYHPVQDQWRRVDEGTLERVRFTANGKFYALLARSIQVYDVRDGVWRRLPGSSFSFAAALMGERRHVVVERVAVVDDELVATVSCRYRSNSVYSFRRIFRCKGFGRENGKIVWEAVSRPGLPLWPFRSWFHRYFVSYTAMSTYI